MFTVARHFNLYYIRSIIFVAADISDLRVNGGHFPRVTVLARRYFCIPSNKAVLTPENVDVYDQFS